jgi:DNA primase
MDCISSFAAGVTETVAVGGTALTEDQVEMLARLADKIYLSMDADEAGHAAMKRSVELAEKRGLSIKVVQIEGGKDPDEIARNSATKWKEMVENSMDVYEYVMERAFKKNDSEKIDGVKKITEEVIPYLAKIQNNIVRERWAKKLAERLGVETKGVMGEIEKNISGKTTATSVVEKDMEEADDSRVAKLGKRLAGLLFVNREAGEKIAPWFAGLSIPGAEGKLVNWIMNSKEGMTFEELIEAVPAELKEVAGEAYMGEEETEDPGSKVVEEMAVQLLREIIRERKKLLMVEMNKAKKEKNEEEEERTFTEMNELNKKESKIIAFLS